MAIKKYISYIITRVGQHWPGSPCSRSRRGPMEVNACILITPKQSLGYQQHSFLLLLLYTTGIFHQFNQSIIYTDTGYNVQLYMAHSPCFYLPLPVPLVLPLCTPFYLLGTLLAVTGIVHLSPRLLVN
jgi:hypothetical protein